MGSGFVLEWEDEHVMKWSMSSAFIQELEDEHLMIWGRSNGVRIHVGKGKE